MRSCTVTTRVMVWSVVAATLLSQTPAQGTTPIAGDQVVAGGSTGRVLIENPLTSGLPTLSKPCGAVHGDGGYIISSILQNTFCNLSVVQPGSFTGPARLEVSVRLRQGTPDALFGLAFGHTQNLNDPYVMVINGNGRYRLARTDGKVWQNLVAETTESAIRTGAGATNRLAVEIQGQTIRGFINGKAVLNAQAPATIPSSLGLYLDTHGMEAVFSDLRVTSLAPPTTVTLTAGGTVVLDDDLQTEQKYEGGRSSFCDKAYADGGYRVENVAKGMCQANLMLLSESPFHARLEVTARLLSGDPAGLFGLRVGQIGAAPINHFFGINSNGEMFLGSRVKDWTELLPRSVTPAVRRGLGATNKLAVEINGRRFRSFVNNTFIGEATSPADVNGWIGLVVEATGARVVFNNLRIVDLVPPKGTAAQLAGAQRLKAPSPEKGSDSEALRSPARAAQAATGPPLPRK